MSKQNGGRRTRRVNAWAKAAGEYYRSHKNDPDIREFSDVLKSPKFKAYYQSKYGKKSSRPASTRKERRSRFIRRSNEEEESKEEESKEEESKEEEEEERPMKKEKKEKKADDWSWGFGEEEEKKPKKAYKRNRYFNGGTPAGTTPSHL
jgi:hypothetical protein